jgi:hypothetical protein
MTDKTLDLAELRRLCEDPETFRRPWTLHRFEIACPCPNGDDCGDTHDCVEVEALEEYPASPKEPAPEGQGQCVVQISIPGLERFAQANGGLIVAAVNALPALLDEVERLTRENEALMRIAEAARQAVDVMVQCGYLFEDDPAEEELADAVEAYAAALAEYDKETKP